MSHYRTGSDFERYVRYVLEDEGFFVVRSAGSRGPVDLVAIRGGYPTMLIQCKVGSIGGADRVALDVMAKDYPGYWVGFATPSADLPKVKFTRSGG